MNIRVLLRRIAGRPAPRLRTVDVETATRRAPEQARIERGERR